MAEPQKSASKEKSSLPDIGIEKDFWKSMSVADDGMDFDFGSAAKGQKGFKFGKMDDFSLDVDFDNPSSFKINMSDLDISSPPKRSGKSKDKSNEASSGGENQPKRDSFSLFFDFNEDGKFNFEPETKKIDEKSNKNKDRVGFGDHLAKDVDAMEDFNILSKPPASCGVSTSKFDMQIDKIEDDPLKCEIDESCLLKPANVEDQQRQRAIAPENIISSNLQEPIQEALSSEKKSPEHDVQQVVQDLSSQSLAENVSMQSAASDIKEKEVGAVARTVNSNTVENQSEDMSSQSQKGEMSMLRDDDDVLIGDTRVDDSDTSKGDSHLENTFMTSGNENLAHGALANQKNADFTSKLCLNTVESGTTADELVTEKERGNTVRPSKYFKKQIRSESELQPVSLSQTKLISMGSSKGLSTTHKNPTVEKMELGSKDVESGHNFTGILRSLPNDLSKGIPVQIENRETDRGKGLDRKGLLADSIKTGSELKTTTVAHDVGATKEEPVSKESDLNTEHSKVLRSDANPSSLNEHLNKAIGQNPGLKVTSLASTQNTRKIVAEKNKNSPIIVERTISEVPNMKASRAIEVKLKPLGSSLSKSKDSTSMRNKEHNEKSRQTMVLKRAPSFDTKKQMLPSPTLKRKRIEKSAEIPRFTPLKCLSASPSSIKASSEKAVNEQVYNHANVADGNAKYAICHTPKLDLSPIKLDTSPVIENDGIVEKAEACSKELEDICHMLKKKHEEAKEILVRAIVNNNNLLMLNHPIYQEKMSMVLKFAASLNLK